MKYILQFSKEGRMAYISHLDLQRLFLRVFRMAQIRPAYSNGFNPHPKLSLALPLSTGFSSECEYLEVETARPIADIDAASAILSDCLPEGIGLLRIFERGEAKEGGGKSLASFVRFAEYRIVAPAFADMEDAVSAYLRETSIIVEKESRKTGRTSPIDIRSMIHAFACVRVLDRSAVFHCALSAGGNGSLNPMTLMTSFYARFGQTFDEAAAEIVRTRIVFEQDIL
jgi:radical SAM-linked protein